MNAAGRMGGQADELARKSAERALISRVRPDTFWSRVSANAGRQEARQAKVAVSVRPRSTVKTTLLREQFDSRAIVNLLRSSVYLPLAENPSQLREIVAEGRVDATAEPPVVVID